METNMIPQIDITVRTSNVTHICMTIEGHHNKESFESSHTIPIEMIQAYLQEFFEAYAENPKSARLSFYYCDCNGCKIK